MKVIIVTPNSSAKVGGESIIPLHYFNFLPDCGVSTLLVTHSRTRDELDTLLSDRLEDVYYVEDTGLQKFISICGCKLPKRISFFFTGFLIDLLTQIEQKKLIKLLVKEQQVDIVHQPIRVSPKLPSLIYNVGVPVIIGPMNGGMTFPSCFQYMHGAAEKYFVSFGRFFSRLLNQIFPGKKYASALLVANQRTANAIPKGLCQNVIELVENGVDLNVFNFSSNGNQQAKEFTSLGQSEQMPQCRFIFVGRLEDWKCVDCLLRAIKTLKENSLNVTLDIVGVGVEKLHLEQLSEALGLNDFVTFQGFRLQADCARLIAESDCLVLPSVYECGGAVVLEAMAMEKPVIAANWGGPADYLDSTCGVLVDIHDSKEAFISKFTDAMAGLAMQPELRKSLGEKGLMKVKEQYCWNSKAKKMKAIYLDIIN